MTTLTETSGAWVVTYGALPVYRSADYLAAYLVARQLGYVVPMTAEQSRAYWQGVSGA